VIVKSSPISTLVDLYSSLPGLSRGEMNCRVMGGGS